MTISIFLAHMFMCANDFMFMLCLLTGHDRFSSFSLTSQRMNNATAITRLNPTISYYGLTYAEGIAISSAFIVACFFIVAGNFLKLFYLH